MKNVALVVDDAELNRELLAEMLEDDYRVVEASNGEEALKLILEHPSEIALVLLDLIMPVMDGFQVLQVLFEKGITEKIPVLIISGETAPETEERCLSYGVTDFVKKPFTPSLLRQRARNAEAMYTYRHHLEEKVREQTGVLLEQTQILRVQNEKLRELNKRIIELMANVIESRSLESGSHVRRVSGFTRILLERLRELQPRYGLTPEQISNIALASSLHDVGKIMIPDGILNKPGKLTPEEFEIMKQHTVLGCEVLDKSRKILEDAHFDECRRICRSHHEKWDGGGYPDGLRGEEIPLEAQVVSLADCYDALTTARVYKRAYSTAEAYEMIMNGQCGAFNPELIECFRSCREDLERFAEENRNN